MPRSKKTRKPGAIGVPKSSSSVSPSAHKKPKKKSGKTPGSRNSLLESKSIASQGRTNANQDRRHGSKVKIELIKEKVQAKPKASLLPKFRSPLDELEYIENDNRLQKLLDKIDNDQTVNDEDQSYVDHLLKRHAILCELLGIDSEESPSEQKDEGDLLDKLENSYKL